MLRYRFTVEERPPGSLAVAEPNGVRPSLIVTPDPLVGVGLKLVGRAVQLLSER